tara:strand:+ start:194 stop:367 length:174 start_codon:yes stop_codon:yes gene_type:complete
LSNNGTTLISFRIPIDKLGAVKYIIENSSSKYRDRTQFLLVAIDDLVLKHIEEDAIP